MATHLASRTVPEMEMARQKVEFNDSVSMDERLWQMVIRALKDVRVESSDFGYDNDDRDLLDEAITEIGEQTGLDPIPL